MRAANRREIMMCNQVAVVLALIGIATSIPYQAAAETVYDTTRAGFGAFTGLPPGQEIGDEITLGGTNREVTQFMFTYNSTTIISPDENEMVRIRFRANDGTSGEPGSVLWESGFLPLIAGTGIEHTINVPNVLVPSTFTWTAEQINVFPSTELSFIAVDQFLIGSSTPFLWRLSSGTWTELNLSSSNNIRARITAVPEPRTLLLVAAAVLILGGEKGRGEGRKTGQNCSVENPWMLAKQLCVSTTYRS